MFSKTFFQSLMLLPLLLLYPYGQAQAEKSPVKSMVIKIDPNDVVAKGNVVHAVSSLELEHLELRDDGALLSMDLPPSPVPFDGYELTPDMSLFVNQQFLNAGTPMQMTASIIHFRHPSAAQKEGPVEHRLNAVTAGFLDSFQKSPRMHDPKILQDKTLTQNGYPARRLTMQASVDGQDNITEALFITFKDDLWGVQLSFNADDTNIVNHAHNLLSSVRISEDAEAAASAAPADKSSASMPEEPPVPPVLREATLNDRGHALSILLPFDIKNEFHYYALSDSASLDDGDDRLSFALNHDLYEKYSTDSSDKGSRPSENELIKATLHQLEDYGIMDWKITRRKTFRLGNHTARRISVTYSDGGTEDFYLDYLFIFADNEDWTISFERRADETEITNDMIDTMFASVRLHEAPSP